MTDPKPLKILIAEDGHADRIMLEHMISELGYQTILAKNGLEAVELFSKEAPSIILMDALMPEMDGFDAARKIRALAGENFVFILFVTSLTEDSSLVSCIEAGGDDFVSKPYRPTIIAAKLRAYTRMLAMHRILQEQRDEISNSNEQLIQEQLTAKKIFDNIAHLGCLDANNIKHMLSPMSLFNGDVLLAARKPSGGLIVLLGDFTGHGLPAAIGTLPTSEIFYSMVSKGFDIDIILKEINHKLHSILPRGYFCCASMMDINYSHQSLTLWNGGLPDVMLKQTKGTTKRFESKYLPLGILSSDKFKADCTEHEMQIGDRVYAFSDGIVETRNDNGELFGLDRIYELLNQNYAQEDLFECLVESAMIYMGQKSHYEDDLTLIEVAMMAEGSKPEGELNKQNSGVLGPRDWAFSFELFNETIRDFNPVPLILHVTMELPELKVHNNDLHIIFSELLSNAIDHGLLNLDSAMKQTSDGFQMYYQQRAEGLNQLEESSVLVSMRHRPEGDGGVLDIEVKDTGTGFEFKNLESAMPGERKFSGRGIPLLVSLCENVEFHGNGNTVKVRYRW